MRTFVSDILVPSVMHVCLTSITTNVTAELAGILEEMRDVHMLVQLALVFEVQLTDVALQRTGVRRIMFIHMLIISP